MHCSLACEISFLAARPDQILATAAFDSHQTVLDLDRQRGGGGGHGIFGRASVVQICLLALVFLVGSGEERVVTRRKGLWFGGKKEDLLIRILT